MKEHKKFDSVCYHFHQPDNMDPVKIPQSILDSQYPSIKDKIDACIDFLLTLPENTYDWQMLRESCSQLEESDYQFLVHYEPEAGKGFMFSSNPTLDKITNKVNIGYSGHSGTSMGWAMRMIQYLVRL